LAEHEQREQSLSPEFWISEWKKHSARSLEEPRLGYRSVHVWDRMARSYGSHNRARVENRDERDFHRERVLRLLEERGALGPGVRVLDVGCGKGMWARAFAERGAEVVGIDFSGKMLQHMREEMPSALREKITSIEADWRVLDLEKENFLKAFDLVFANMTPAIDGPEMFLKLMEASRNWCFFAGWAGKRREPLLEGLWKELTGREKTVFNSDIIFPFNLVYAMDLDPCLELREIGWQREEELQEAEDFFSNLFVDVLKKPKETIRQEVRSYLLTQAKDGKVTRSTTGRTGFMIWRAEKTW
jgi:SAM-dependent methyltransferase